MQVIKNITSTFHHQLHKKSNSSWQPESFTKKHWTSTTSSNGTFSSVKTLEKISKQPLVCAAYFYKHPKHPNLGADVEVLGKWVPLREYATEKEPILMLRVSADSPEKLEAALRKLDEIMGLAEKIQKLTMSTMSLGKPYANLLIK